MNRRGFCQAFADRKRFLAHQGAGPSAGCQSLLHPSYRIQPLTFGSPKKTKELGELKPVQDQAALASRLKMSRIIATWMRVSLVCTLRS
jgi:hypothetical protein